MVGTRRTACRPTLGDARGFTLVEFMISALIMTAVLGGTVMLASQLQQGYSTQLDDVVVEQEVRYALAWIARVLRSAGSNPYGLMTSDCPSVGTPFEAIRIDPDGDGEDDDIRIQADISPPNNLLGGLAGGLGGPEQLRCLSHGDLHVFTAWMPSRTASSSRHPQVGRRRITIQGESSCGA